MTSNHLSFREMSALYDNDIAIEDRKNSMLDHIESCELCKQEYLKLQNMMKLLSRYRNQEYPDFDLKHSVISKYKFRKKRRIFIKTLPAVAALAFFIIGIQVNPLWQTQKGSQDSFASIESPSVKTQNQKSDTQKVIDIISGNSAAITNVTDLYIEGEIEYSKFNKLRKNLGFRKVTYSFSKGDITSNLSNIENVGITNNGEYSRSYKQPLPQKAMVKFRVYK